MVQVPATDEGAQLPLIHRQRPPCIRPCLGRIRLEDLPDGLFVQQHDVGLAAVGARFEESPGPTFFQAEERRDRYPLRQDEFGRLMGDLEKLRLRGGDRQYLRAGCPKLCSAFPRR